MCVSFIFKKLVEIRSQSFAIILILRNSISEATLPCSFLPTFSMAINSIFACFFYGGNSNFGCLLHMGQLYFCLFSPWESTLFLPAFSMGVNSIFACLLHGVNSIFACLFHGVSSIFACLLHGVNSIFACLFHGWQDYGKTTRDCMVC